ncbi:MAG: sugar transferase [Candidatus Electrothrix sp. MAN1_4]|nr:sugar transferase [Candidatus Electrothrix sp. MAN1_4]
MSSLSRKSILFLEITVDFLSVFSSFVIAYWLDTWLKGNDISQGEWIYYQLGITAGCLSITVFYINGLYRHQASMMNLLETKKVIKTTLLLFLVLVLYSFFLQADYRRSTLFLALCLTLLLLLVARFLFFKIYQLLFLQGMHVRKVLIFGVGASGRLLYQSISNTPKLGYLPVGFFDLEGSWEQIEDLCIDQHKNIILITDPDECLKIIEQQNIQDIFFSDALSAKQPAQYLHRLLGFCRACKVNFHAVPYLEPLFSEQVEMHSINGIPLLAFREIPAKHIEKWVKRCLDVTISSLLLTLTAPFSLIIAVMVKLDSKGPILFRQQRVGKDGVPFSMYKFRSMFTDAPVFHNSPNKSGDSRVTKVGRILRKTSLDELPQLLNVLQGSMSLVGPRPEMEFIVNNVYNDLYRQRLRVKPGITGIWQISADRSREIHEDISYDLFYITNQSLLLDMLILLRTIPALFTMHTY